MWGWIYGPLSSHFQPDEPNIRLDSLATRYLTTEFVCVAKHVHHLQQFSQLNDAITYLLDVCVQPLDSVTPLEPAIFLLKTTF